MKSKFSIDIDNSINSGQVFLWEKDGANWYGINGQEVLKVNKNRTIKSILNSKTNFFRKNDNMEEIIRSISKDKTVKNAVKEYGGLRIFDQEPFQCMISFIISSNSNIQKIKSSLEKITKKFGTKITIQNKEFFLFPKPEEIAKATISWPIFKGGKNTASLNRSKNLQNRKKLLLDNATRMNDTNVATAWSSLQSSRSLLNSVTLQVRAAEIANEGITVEYESGLGRSTLDVIQSNSLLLSSKISMAESERNYLLSQFKLLQAIGNLSNDYLKLQ